MDELLKEITSLKPVKRFSITFSVRGHNSWFCEQHGAKRLRGHKCLRSAVCYVPAAIKIRCKEFGHEMHRIKKEENDLNLIDWLYREASLRSRVKKGVTYHSNTGDHRFQFSRKSDNHATNSEKPNYVCAGQAVKPSTFFLTAQCF